ncbi:MAG: SAM-dependent methyltransferase [Bdellovibrionota bacterium]
MAPTTVRSFQADRVAKPSSLEGFSFPRAFTDGAPLDLEIGCGVGWHPIAYAKANPDRRLIAIEHTREKFERFEGRLAKNHPLDNLLAVHGNAVNWVTNALERETLSRVFIMYPNPEPNAPNKRWFRTPFFARLLWTLELGGTITLATNVETYIAEAIEYARAEWKLEAGALRSFANANAPPETPRTHFEKKYLQRGETCFDCVFTKREKQ